MDDEIIKVQMLGDFSIIAGGVALREMSKRSAPKFWKVLQYFITFRHKTVSNEELADAIWPDSDGADPGNSIRNMVFRIRAMLADSGISFGKEMILYNGVGYSWNNRLNCIIDFEEFEKLCRQAFSDVSSDREPLDMLLEAIGLYQGDFLPNASCEMWAMPMTSYYRTLFFKCVHTALRLLVEQERYAEVEDVCKRALLIDGFDEKVHEYHLRSLIQQGKQAVALEEYQKMADLFYEELGAAPSDSLNDLYIDIQQLGSNNKQNLEDTVQEWLVSADFPGAYYCESAVFKIIYQHEARSVVRSGKSIYIVSIEVVDNSDKPKKTMLVMENLYAIIQISLRKGDLFTRIGPSQYLLMLQILTYENCKMLAKRILRAHNKKYRSVNLKITIQPIVPII